MKNNKTFLGIIPARGNSKRLQRKNILELAGKPLIAWTIEAALNAQYLDEVMVTTDDREIADIARKLNASVPFLRPKELAEDDTTSFDVVKHALEFYRNELNKQFDYTLLLQPTSPLRKHSDIDCAIDFLEKKQADAVISVCEVDHSPAWANVLPENLSMKDFRERILKKSRSQDLPTYYRPNGAIYICKTDVLLRNETFYIDDNIYAFIMNKEKSVDIDDQYDFEIAEHLFSRKN